LPVDTRWAAALWPTVVAACAVLTVLAVVLLWPNGGDAFDDPLLLDADPIDAVVVASIWWGARSHLPTSVPCRLRAVGRHLRRGVRGDRGDGAGPASMWATRSR
jgi:hypothetical protein